MHGTNLAGPGGQAGGQKINLEIEYLRAVAVLLVILAHGRFLVPDFIYGQWTGVDLFFCISGFVISRSFQQSFDDSVKRGQWKSTATAFWVRRMFRLLPSAWLWIAIYFIASFFFADWFRSPQEAGRAILYVLTFTMNFALGTGAQPSASFYWSLALEDQFYFVFPFFLLLFRGHWRWITLLLLICLQSIPDRMIGTMPHPPLLWATRLDALMWGCLIYQFSRSTLYGKLTPLLRHLRVVALGISAILIYLLIELPIGTFGPWIGYRIESQVALVSAALVFLASFDRGYALPLSGLVQDVFTWIGSRSYGLYLIHLPLAGIVSPLWLHVIAPRLGESAPDPRIVWAIVLPVLLVAVAELNFRFVETPLRRMGAGIANGILTRNSIPEAQKISQ